MLHVLLVVNGLFVTAAAWRAPVWLLASPWNGLAQIAFLLAIVSCVALSRQRARIRERRQIEQALRRSVDRYEDFVRRAPDPILVFDRRGRLRKANPAATALLGRPLPTLVDQHFRQLRELRPSSRRRMVSAVRRLLLEGAAPVLELELQQADGEIAILEARQRLVWHAGAAGEVEVIVRDVTARQRAEDARRLASELRVARERERVVMARRLHDEVAQSMTAIGLGLISSHMANADPQLTKQIRNLRLLVESSVATVRTVISELRPSVLDDFGLAAAVDWQAREFENRTGVECTVDVQEGEETCPPELAVGVFRILQDLLHSVFDGASSTQVHILLRVEKEEIFLRASDDGPTARAAPPPQRPYSVSRLRAHARSLGGELKIEPSFPIGVIAWLRVPLVAS